MEFLPILKRANLILRAHQDDDKLNLVKYANDKKISDQIINIPNPYKGSDAVARLDFVRRGFADKQRFVFVITLESSDELIGEIGIHKDPGTNEAQFGYWVAEPFRGKGIATEAVAAILKFGFEELKLNRIYATHYPENISSGKVMQKNKMKCEGEIKSLYKIGEVFRNAIQYSLTSEEFLAI
jgi:ribosomal-protein-alanine N-acetyltransferase